MSDTTTTPPAASTDIATPAVAVPVVAVTPPVVASPVVPPAAPVVAAPRVLNPYASPKVAAAPVDPRFAALEASAAASSAALGRHAMNVLAEAPEALRNAVRAIAGEDPVRQLDTLAAMRAHGLGGSASVLPVGASTAVPAQQPAPAAGSQRALGASVSNPYGNVQVRVTVKDGAITRVTAVELPYADGTSQSISDQVGPLLAQQASAAQSGQIDGVTGATYTSDAYRQSLQSALDQLGFRG